MLTDLYKEMYTATVKINKNNTEYEQRSDTR